ncbi:hypothetical protein HV417_02150 [Bacillus sporothermodurans]|uniref:hypothetical protein n=1 Tax=Heyndrickxia sporothermodurans TaxID=46224 RepID=UPI00192C1031|nr:hypothetical protein [Heyndrickxia sporothermodurans]MBL5830866.1 hypothetical protein [Heyndrickxia sporothermodurans]MBL5872365.1 hypothetical protein [Heyndrickxia sporothermodurans]
MKVKTLRDNVGTLNKKGTILEVSEEQGKHFIKVGVAEEVKEKKTTKKTKKEGE